MHSGGAWALHLMAMAMARQGSKRTYSVNTYVICVAISAMNTL